MPVPPDHANDGVVPPLRRNRDYRLLLTGSTLSSLGNGMLSLGIMLLIVDLTRSPAKAGVVTGAYGVGQWIMMLPAGAVCDRWNRKRVMVVSALTCALILGSVPLADVLGVLTFPHMLLAAVLLGAAGCFYSPAEQAALKRIVPAEQMGTALSLNQARSSLGGVVGSPAAAALFSLTRSLPMAVYALLSLAAAACAGAVRTHLPAPSSDPVRLRGLVRDVVAGIQWVWKARAIRDMVLCGMVLNLGLNGIFTSAFLALQLGGTSPQALGLMDAGVGVVGILAALAAPWVLRQARVGHIAVTAIVVLAAMGLAMPLRLSVWWIGGLLALGELALIPLNAGMGAYRVHITPDAVQGRTSSAASFLSLAMMPLASAGAGLALEHLGVARTLLLFAAALSLGGFACVLSRPIRSIPKVADLADVPEVSI
nr:MFS transporter [Actinomyces sp.]